MRIYLLSYETEEFSYADEASNQLSYQYARKLMQIKEELESYFVGKTETEVLDEYNDGTLTDNVMNGKQHIKEIEFGLDTSEVVINSLLIELNGTTYDVDDNCGIPLMQEDGEYTMVQFMGGN